MNQTGDRGVLADEIDLAEAALLYADEVEIVSLSVAMLDGLRTVTQDGSNGMFDLIDALGPDVVAHLGGGNLPSDWRSQFDRMMTLDPDLVEQIDPSAASTVHEIQDQVRAMSERARSDLGSLLDATGASELTPALHAKVLKVAVWRPRTRSPCARSGARRRAWSSSSAPSTDGPVSR
jgi:hypothetical protein